MAGSQIPIITADGYAQRMAALIPRGWANDSAKQPGGVLYALLETIGTQFNFINTALQYALNTTRIQTETSPELDEASEDFFGDALPRPPGATDAAFLALIQSNLLQPGATRQAVSNAVQKITGVAPRIIEPWNPGDTGCIDVATFIDIDTKANPFIMSGEDRYQGFIETILPPITSLGNNPLLTSDDGAYLDVNLYGDTLQGVLQGLSAIYNAINAVRPFGTIAWVKIVPQVL